MNDQDSFLRTIIDSPDDDAPRLVYADFLEERGDAERAEFIRLQCASALIRGVQGKEENLRTMHEQERQLLTQKNVQKWTGFAPTQDLRTRFHRGFVHGIGDIFVAPDPSIMEKIRHIFSQHPVQQMMLTGVEQKHWYEISEKFAPRLNALHVRNTPLSINQVTALIQSLTRDRIRTLQFAGGNGLRDVTTERITSGMPYPKLEELMIAGEETITDETAERIADSSQFPAVKRVILSGTRITHQGVIALLRSPSLPSLQYVDVEGSEDVQLTEELIEAIVEVDSRCRVNTETMDPEFEHDLHKMARRAGVNYFGPFKHW